MKTSSIETSRKVYVKSQGMLSLEKSIRYLLYFYKMVHKQFIFNINKSNQISYAYVRICMCMRIDEYIDLNLSCVLEFQKVCFWSFYN